MCIRDRNIVEAAELTRNILIDWIPIFEDKQIDYNIDIPEHPFRVKLDTDGYMRILNNLIQNVICLLYTSVSIRPLTAARIYRRRNWKN